MGTIGTLKAPQRHQCLQVDVISGSGWQPRSGCSYFQCRFCAMLNNIPCMAADRKMRRFLFDSPLPSLPRPPPPTPPRSGILSSINWPGKGSVCECVCVCVCGPRGSGGGSLSGFPVVLHLNRATVEGREWGLGLGKQGLENWIVAGGLFGEVVSAFTNNHESSLSYSL